MKGVAVKGVAVKGVVVNEESSSEGASCENRQRIKDVWLPWDRRLGLTSPATKDCK